MSKLILSALALASLVGLARAQFTEVAYAGAWEHGHCLAVALASDTLAYAGDGAWIAAVDVRDGSVLAREPVGAMVLELELDGTTLLARAAGDVLAWDAADPLALAPWFEIRDRDYVGFAAADGLLCAFDGDRCELWAMGPVPALMGTIPREVFFSSPLSHAALDEGLLALGGGFQVDLFDVHLPAAPQWRASLDVDGGRAIALRDTLLVCTANGPSDSVRCWSVADPGAPAELGAIRAGFAAELALRGRKLALTDFATLEVHDLTDPAAPVLVDARPATNLRDLDVRGPHVLTADWDFCRSYSIGLAEGLDSLATAWTGGYANLAASGDRLYLAFWNSGHGAVLDLSDPAQPVEAGPRFGFGRLGGLAIWQQRLLGVTSQVGSLFLLTDPAHPQLVGEDSLTNIAAGSQNGRFYWSHHEWPGPDSLVARDLGAAGGLARVSAIEAPSPTTTSFVRTSGDLLVYDSGPTLGLQFVDVADPAQPQLLEAWQPRPGRVYEEASLSGRRGVVSAGDSLFLFNREGEAPQLEAAVQLADGDFVIAVLHLGTHLLVGGYRGLYVYWLQDPAAPRLIHFDPVEGGVHALVAQADRIVGQNNRGTRIWSRSVLDFRVEIGVSGPVFPRVELSWPEIPWASGYRVESSPDPSQGGWTERAVVEGGGWTDPLPIAADGRRCYRVSVLVD